MGKEFSRDGIALWSIGQLADPALAPAIRPDALAFYHLIGQWIAAYLMRSHPDLGRAGEVCPYTSRAYRLDTIRIAVSFASPGDTATVKSHMQLCLREFAAIPCDLSMRHYRTVIVGFPNLDDEDGLATMK